MKSTEEKRARAQRTVLTALETLVGKKLEWDTLPEDVKSKLEPSVEEFSQKPELRMRKSMETVAAKVGLRWTSDWPSDHPYESHLDGQLFAGKERVAVVELEARVPKQVRGALLDLVCHPARKRILVIGVSDAVSDPEAVKEHITERVMPTLSHVFGFKEEIGVFTERELMEAPEKLAAFLRI